jgi:hypothetical protein
MSSGPVYALDAVARRIKAPLEYSRCPDKTWVYGELRVAGPYPNVRAVSAAQPGDVVRGG